MCASYQTFQLMYKDIMFIILLKVPTESIKSDFGLQEE